MRTTRFVIGTCALLFILSGCLLITIDPQLNNPFQITLSGARELLPLGEQMTVTATVIDENNCTIFPDRYEWYLQGSILKEKSGTITVGSGLPVGIYMLDLVVTKDGIPSSEGVAFEVVKNP